MKQLSDLELRIGNLVLDSTKNTTRIESIIPEHNRIRYGIELTEEWLLRFGFEPTKAPYSDQKAWVHGEYNKRLIWCANEIYKPIFAGFVKITQSEYIKDQPPVQFVHQLQNLYFALTGSELELKSLPETIIK